MANISGFYKPDFTLMHNGQKVAFNKIILDSSTLGILLKIDSSLDIGKSEGDILTGSLTWADSKTDQLFTVVITDVISLGNKLRLVCKELYYNEMNKSLETTSWRNSTLKGILADIFEMAELKDYDLTSCPDINISRFSIPSGFTGYICLSLLFEMVQASYGTLLAWQPNTDGVLIIGEKSNIKNKMSSTISFRKDTNIISRTPDFIKAFALPVLENQDVVIDNETLLCVRSILTIKPGKYRLEMEVKQ